MLLQLRGEPGNDQLQHLNERGDDADEGDQLEERKIQGSQTHPGQRTGREDVRVEQIV